MILSQERLRVSDLSKPYRDALREMWSRNEFRTDPERHRRMEVFLNSWDKWAYLTDLELRLLDKMSSVWAMVLVVPAVYYGYRAYQVRQKVSVEAKVLDQAQMYLDQWGRERGQCMREMEAIRATKTDLLR